MKEKKKEGMPASVYGPLYIMTLKAAVNNVLKDKDVKVGKKCN